MVEEIWKQVDGFSNYEISNHGRLRNISGRMLKNINNGNGYFRVTLLADDGTKKKRYIHRLVAQAFVNNPQKKPCINHIDCDPSNNYFENLEWCTKKENSEHMVKLGRNKRTEEWLHHLHESQRRDYKAVIATSIKTGETLYFEKLNDVKKAGFQSSCVCLCCKGDRGITQHNGYRWRYA